MSPGLGLELMDPMSGWKNCPIALFGALDRAFRSKSLGKVSAYDMIQEVPMSTATQAD